MPTYDYACSACRHRFERFEGISQGGLKTCPKCGKRKARRMLGTGAGLIFKGAGFYAVDSRPSSPVSTGTDKKKETPASKDSGKKPDKKEPGS